MSLASHLEELQRKHGDIERQLDEAMNHPSVDDLQLVALKRRKLALKDEIEKLKGSPTQH
ncbi:MULTISPECIES: YdcH family protein [Phyllobacteriaceae]|uniref:YdcH family protein n=1 Tax=Phyllobacteriaceae TaxID=69277 RepID=UPI0030A1FEDF